VRTSKDRRGRAAHREPPQWCPATPPPPLTASLCSTRSPELLRHQHRRGRAARRISSTMAANIVGVAAMSPASWSSCSECSAGSWKFPEH
jgi:hypothetical protein